MIIPIDWHFFSFCIPCSFSPLLLILVLYLNDRFRVIHLNLELYFEWKLWQETIRIETLSSLSSAGIHSYTFKENGEDIPLAIMGHCLQRYGQDTGQRGKRLRKPTGRQKVAKLFPPLRPLDDTASLTMSGKQVVTFVVLYLVFKEKDTHECFSV